MSSLDLWRCGVEDEADRQRLLEAACAVHKREWKESSLPDIGQNPNPVDSYTNRSRVAQPQKSAAAGAPPTSSTAYPKGAYGSAYVPNGSSQAPAAAAAQPAVSGAGQPETATDERRILDERRSQRRQLKHKSQRERDSAGRRAQLLSLNDTYAVLLNLATHARFMQSTTVFLSKCISDSSQASQGIHFDA